MKPFRLTSPIASEDMEHVALARMLRVLIAPPGELSPHGVAWFSVEHRNAASVVEGANRKRRGVIAGIPDVLIRHGAMCYWLELKRCGGKPSEAQCRLHAVLEKLGDQVAVCEGARAALDQIIAWHVPMRGRVNA